MVTDYEKGRRQLVEEVRTLRSKLSKLEPVKVKANPVEQMSAEREIKSLALFVSEDPYPVLRVSIDGKVLYANRASIAMLRERESKIGGPAPSEWHKATQEALNSRSVITVEVKHKDRTFALSVIPVSGADYCNFYGIDITENKKIEQERDVTIRLLSLMNTINHPHEMMKLVARLLKDWSGCEAVGIRLAEGEDFPYYVTSGFEEDFILAENKLCSVNELGELIRDSQGRPYLECMCGNIISGRFDPSKPFFTEHGSFWTNSTTELLAGTTENDRLAKTRNRCNTAGYESVALIPLRIGDKTFGLLQFNDKQKGRFTTEKIFLFERLADNLAIGLAQRRAEQALQESRDHLDSILNSMYEAMVEVDRDFTIREVNDCFLRQYGTTREDVIGRKCYEITHGFGQPCSGSEHICPAEMVFAGGKARETEHIHLNHGGNERIVEIHAFPLLAEDGNVKSVVELYQDITERKQAEQALNESEIKFRELFESMSSGVTVYEAIDDGGDFVFKDMNKAGERIEKINRADIIGKKVIEAFPGVKKLGLFEVFQRVWRTGNAEHHPVSLYKDKRLTHWVENYVYKLPTGEIVAVYDDVTERKQVEEKLTDYYSKLKAMAISSLLTEEHERQLIAQGLHDDIGQRLAMTKMYLQSYLKNEAHQQSSSELNGKLCSNIDAMIERVRSLTFELSNPVLTELGLEAAIERHLGREVRDKSGIEFELVRCGLLTHLDENLNICLFRSVRELLNNIVKHSQAKKVMISLSIENNEIVITVEDDGIGFDSAEVRRRIGDGGTFGLFSVQEQLESFGGRLTIESKPGRGSRFTIVVPSDATAPKS